MPTKPIQPNAAYPTTAPGISSGATGASPPNDELSGLTTERNHGAMFFRKTTMTPERSTRILPMVGRLIAPCGMNCRLCQAYNRDKKACPGCRGDDSVKSKTCVTCRIKNCEKMARGGVWYCFNCDSFPCDRLNHLDKRYRTKYGMSMIDNLVKLKNLGLRQFIQTEKERWTCPECDEIICVHKPYCLSCERKWR